MKFSKKDTKDSSMNPLSITNYITFGNLLNPSPPQFFHL